MGADLPPVTRETVSTHTIWPTCDYNLFFPLAPLFFLSLIHLCPHSTSISSPGALQELGLRKDLILSLPLGGPQSWMSQDEAVARLNSRLPLTGSQILERTMPLIS